MTTNRIFELRSERGISQEELADAIGTSRRAIGLWETDKVKPRERYRIKLSEYFGVPKSEFDPPSFSATDAPSVEYVGFREVMARIRGILGRCPRYSVWCQIVDDGLIPSYPDPFRNSCTGSRVRLYKWPEVKAWIESQMNPHKRVVR